MNSNNIPIAEIQLANRFRKDLGDLTSLVNSIDEIGLMHPVVIRENGKDYELIAGQRRLEACKKLGWYEIPVTVLNMDEVITGEFHENVVRKEFAISERVDILEAIEKLRIGHKVRKDSKLESFSKFQKEYKDQRSVDIVAKLIGVSQGELAKEKYVVQAVRKNPSKFGDLIPKIDSGKISVESAYKEIKDETWKQKQIEDNKIPENNFERLISKDQIRILEGDFRNVVLKELKSNSVGLIFTDPPYDKGSLHLYKNLAEISAILLKSGGSLITYLGQYALPEILDSICKVRSLTFWWELRIQLEGPFPRYFDRQIKVQTKPLLWFVKGNRPINPSFPTTKESGKRNIMGDLIPSKKPDKRFHDFGQSPSDAEYCLKYLTGVNDLVLDPFLGGGTTAIACMNMKRRFVGIDINPAVIEAAKANIRLNLENGIAKK